MGERIRIVIAEDHTILREAITALLDEQPDFEVVGHAVDGEDAVEHVQRLRPDVAILDLNMPRLNGNQAAEKITLSCPGVKIIGLSMHEESVIRSAMQQAGAVAYVEKCGPIEWLFSAIRDAVR